MMENSSTASTSHEKDLRDSDATPGPVTPYRVLHVLDHSQPLLSGYSVRSHSLLTAQRRIGFAPRVVTGPLHELEDAGGAETTIDGISYQRTPLPRGLGRNVLEKRMPIIREIAVVRLLRRRILELLEEQPTDVIHAHSPSLCGLAAVQAGRLRGVPVVYEIRAFWEDAAVDQRKTQTHSLRYQVSRRLEGYVASRAGAVVGIARHILADLRERGLDSRKLFHVPNGVDAERFVAVPHDVRLAQELGLTAEPVLGFIGSLYRYEGVSWLVRAAAELRRRGSRFQLLIVGQGEDLPEIRKAITESGAQDYAHAIGSVPHEQVQRYYSLMDVLVYPRRSVRLTELTTPLKPLEAMAQAKPVLASDVGGIRELMEPEQPCLLFSPDSVEDFCLKARQLVGDAGFRRDMGQRAREMILREKDWKVLARRYEGVYDFATHGRRDPR